MSIVKFADARDALRNESFLSTSSNKTVTFVEEVTVYTYSFHLNGPCEHAVWGDSKCAACAVACVCGRCVHCTARADHSHAALMEIECGDDCDSLFESDDDLDHSTLSSAAASDVDAAQFSSFATTTKTGSILRRTRQATGGSFKQLVKIVKKSAKYVNPKRVFA
eukprot:Rhum_TRINITY_DN15500_c1_g1::Rhum_TRINITY_DN15500_c1_g1_i1::g.161421::m.161421